ncbi:MAG: phosphoribosylaminoimidazolesuccinocarboxamide synthase, partial [Candidatus Tumulicola sp.]
VVTRGVAAGSFVKRNPAAARGALLVPRVVEFFLKDDANHDPLVTPEQIVAQSLASPQEIATMSELARLTFDILAHAWRRRDVMLVDLKIEFGRLASGENQGQLVVADVIDNDSWRIWPQGREDLMLDKQMYRNLQTVDDEALATVKRAYERVAEMTGSFPVMRPGMIAVIAETPALVERANEIALAFGQLGMPTVRHVANPATTPLYVLQLVQQIETTFARVAFVAAGESDVLRAMLEAATSSPVLDGRADAPQLALHCAKIFGLEDTVLFGRTLLMLANARTSVVAADSSLQQQAVSAQGVALG